MPSSFSDVARAGGAVVMGTGIVSVALALDGEDMFSEILLVLAAAVLVAVGVAVLALAIADRRSLREIACTPAALTWIAGTNVVGSRLTFLGRHHEAAVLFGIGVALWLVVVPCVAKHWTTPTVGLSFLLVVATESIAVLAARLSLTQLALAAFALGIALYLVVLARFDVRQLVVGRGDHWIVGGALAIAALACARCAQTTPGLHTAALAVWAAAAAWLPVLVVSEARRARRAFDERWWSTVFPLGMYAACSFAVGRVADVTVLTRFAGAWVWVAVAAWFVVATATARRLT